METQLDKKRTFIVDVPFVECYDRLALLRDQIHAPTVYTSPIEKKRRAVAMKIEETVHIASGFTLIPLKVVLINLASTGQTKLHIMCDYQSAFSAWIIISAVLLMAHHFDYKSNHSGLTFIAIIGIISLIATWLRIQYAEARAQSEIESYLLDKKKRIQANHAIGVDKSFEDVMTILERQPPYLERYLLRYVVSSRRLTSSESEISIQRYYEGRYGWSTNTAVTGIIRYDESLGKTVITLKPVHASSLVYSGIFLSAIFLGYALLLYDPIPGALIAGLLSILLLVGNISGGRLADPYRPFMSYLCHIFKVDELERLKH